MLIKKVDITFLFSALSFIKNKKKCKLIKSFINLQDINPKIGVNIFINDNDNNKNE